MGIIISPGLTKVGIETRGHHSQPRVEESRHRDTLRYGNIISPGLKKAGIETR